MMSCRFKRFGRLLLLTAASLPVVPVLAQTIPGGDPYEGPLQRCRADLGQQPQASLRVASDLLAKPELPLPVRVMATGCLATAQQLVGDSAKATASTERLLALLQTPGLPPIVHNNERLQAAMLLQQLGQLPRAIALMEQIQADAVAAGDLAMQINALISIALMRGALDDPEGALTYFQQANALSERLQRPPATGDMVLHYNYAYTLLVLKRYDEADRAFERATQTGTQLGNQDVLLNRIVSHRGEIQRASGHLERAEPLVQQALQWQQTHGDRQGAVVSLHRLARLRLEQRRNADALAYAEQAQALAVRGNYMVEIRDGLDVLGEVHATLGDSAAAARDAQQAHAMDRAKARGETYAALANLQAAAAQTPRSVDARVARADNTGTVAIGLALAVTLGAVLVVLYRRRQRHALDLGQRDPLTGLLNRPEAERRMQALFAVAPEQAGDADNRCALLLVDVDGFKALNARYGHAAGDRALLALATCLRESCDADDLVARWGSEEFLVVRADTSSAAAFALAAHLRGTAERLRVDAGQGELLPLTVSVGVAPFPLFHRPDARLQDSVALAERAVQAAGHAGGNAWAGLWGVQGDAATTPQQVLQDPLQARAQGWVLLDGSDPLLWTRAFDAPAPRRA
ncbi:Diguanylate cyclase, GGDEF domain [Xanthomonas sp. GW]|uniref:diguanylate cyclase n=1 Tax=Xanthomonas sp. GW TaxID=2724121 RepID=UPI001639AAFF|nr:diguanylate cyclase [Xanthomonas sp. GW]QNH23363.1 Diguanylate cyclase, GGDEF domain [Xanthomonas sp. GW]